tara:strand:- start:2577 stop:3131 length:555 start_codon:yes stop_codon:yes gene_type:complete
MRLRHGTPFIYDDAGDIAGLRDPDGSELYLVPRIGVMFDTTTQTDGSGAVPMEFNTQAIARGVTLVEGSKIYVDRTGLYEFTLSVHVHNDDSQAHSFQLWGRLNGVDIPNSRFIYSVPAKHGSTPGAIIPSQNFWLALNAGQYVQILWATDDAEVTIAYHAAEAGKPVSPSLLLTVKEITPTKA